MRGGGSADQDGFSSGQLPIRPTRLPAEQHTTCCDSGLQPVLAGPQGRQSCDCALTSCVCVCVGLSLHEAAGRLGLSCLCACACALCGCRNAFFVLNAPLCSSLLCVNLKCLSQVQSLPRYVCLCWTAHTASPHAAVCCYLPWLVTQLCLGMCPLILKRVHSPYAEHAPHTITGCGDRKQCLLVCVRACVCALCSAACLIVCLCVCLIDPCWPLLCT